MEELIGTLKDDMKELKEAVKHLTEAFTAMKERILRNEMDFETIIKEYARTGAQIEELKKTGSAQIEELKRYVNEQDQHIWDEIRRFQQAQQEACKETHKICNEKLIPEAKADVKKDVKLWVYAAILTAIGALAGSIIVKAVPSNITSDPLKYKTRTEIFHQKKAEKKAEEVSSNE
jgi:chromosome segregation ATPase